MPWSAFQCLYLEDKLENNIFIITPLSYKLFLKKENDKCVEKQRVAEP